MSVTPEEIGTITPGESAPAPPIAEALLEVVELLRGLSLISGRKVLLGGIEIVEAKLLVRCNAQVVEAAHFAEIGVPFIRNLHHYTRPQHTIATACQ